MRRRPSLLCLALLAACDRSASAPLPPPDLPARMHLEATAEGLVGDLTITCAVDWVVQMTREWSYYEGAFGGDIRRTVLEPSEAGIEFWGEAYSEARLQFGPGGAVSLVSYVNGAPAPAVTDSRFWEGVRRFDGALTDGGDALAAGTWQCRPMDARGDTIGTVPGSWRLTALP